jgi:Family of unknown function (DUF5681)
MTEANPEEDAGVGYKRPPRHSRFRPGRSGNPRGREKSLRNFATDVKATLAGPLAIKERGKTKRVSSQEGMLLRLREKALQGDARALDQFIRLAQMFNNDGPNEVLGAQDMLAEDREILDAYAEAIRSRPSSDVEVDPVPEESAGNNADG